MSIYSRTFALPVLLLLLLLQGCAGEENPRYNVILISVDALRADHLGCYGYARDTSPNLDALAGDGILFENAFSQSHWTPPSHMSMLTSLYPSVHDVRDYPEVKKLSDNIRILPEYLKDAGCDTYGMYSNSWMSPALGFGKGYDRYENVGSAPGQVEEALSFIDSSHAGGSSFFLFMHMIDVHTPYFKPGYMDHSYSEMYDPGYEGEYTDGNGPSIYGLYDKMAGGEDVERDVRHIEALYDGAINFTDRSLGELIEGLKSRGLYDNTIIVITSDHGEEFGEHGGLMHHHLFVEQVHVPLIVRLPSELMEAWNTGPGARLSPTVRSIDIMPTILDALGVPFEDFHQGVSLLPVLAEPDSPGFVVYAESEQCKLWKQYDYQRSVMDDEYHFIFWRARKPDAAGDIPYMVRLYRRSDKKEVEDISGEFPELVKSYAADIAKWEKEMAVYSAELNSGAEGERVKFSRDDINKLKALGYLQ